MEENMWIKTVEIKNFRLLKDVSIDFNNLTSFIGPNGSGKSSVLYALEWFFNANPSILSVEDCNEPDKEIKVKVTFNNITEHDRDILGIYAKPASDELSVWKIFNPLDNDNPEKFSANLYVHKPFYEILYDENGNPKGKTEIKNSYNEFLDKNPEYNLSKVTSGNKAEENIKNYDITKLDINEILSPDATSFFGYRKENTLSKIFDYVFISADMRASEESLESSQKTVLGKIIDKIIEPDKRAELSKKVDNIIVDAQENIKKSIGEEEFIEASNGISEILQEFCGEKTVKLQVAEIEFRKPKTPFEVFIVESESLLTNVDRQGHGVQRSLLLALLRYLAESSNSSQKRTIFIAVEEPELYQHPQQEIVFEHVLRKLSDRPDTQVSYVTHSSNFVNPRKFEDIRRIIRNYKSNSSTIVSSKKDNIVEKVSNQFGININQDDISKLIENVDNTIIPAIEKGLSKSFFADKVIIVEGSTEIALINGYFASNGLRKSPEYRGIQVLESHGKTKIAIRHAILTSLGIDVFTIFDNDIKNKYNLERDINELNLNIKLDTLPLKDISDRILSYLNNSSIKDSRKEQIKGHLKNYINEAKNNERLLNYFKCDNVTYYPESGLYSDYNFAILDDNLEETVRKYWAGLYDTLPRRNNKITKDSVAYYEHVYNKCIMGYGPDEGTCIDDILKYILNF